MAMPVTLLYQGIPFSSWLHPLGTLASVGGILSGMAIFMAWLYCELYASKLNRSVSALVYSTVCPIIFICVLGFVMLIKQGVFLSGISDSEGKKELFLILTIFAPVCFSIYWSGSKNA